MAILAKNCKKQFKPFLKKMGPVVHASKKSPASVSAVA
jgi:hypothetical protein